MRIEQHTTENARAAGRTRQARLALPLEHTWRTERCASGREAEQPTSPRCAEFLNLAFYPAPAAFRVTDALIAFVIDGAPEKGWASSVLPRRGSGRARRTSMKSHRAVTRGYQHQSQQRQDAALRSQTHVRSRLQRAGNIPLRHRCRSHPARTNKAYPPPPTCSSRDPRSHCKRYSPAWLGRQLRRGGTCRR